MLARLFSIFESKPKPKSDDTPKLDKLKKELISLVENNNPPEFYNFFDDELLKSPILTDSGLIFEKDSLKAWLNQKPECPLTRRPLNESKLSDASLMTDTVEIFQADKVSILNMINTMKLVEENQARLLVGKYLKRVEGYRKSFSDHQEILSVQQILRAKERLKLDIKSAAHLEFWNENRCCIRRGLEKVVCDGKKFYIAPRVYKVMIAANKEYKRLVDFFEAIDKARKSVTFKPGSWAEFWSVTEKSKTLDEKNLFEKNFKLS